MPPRGLDPELQISPYPTPPGLKLQLDIFDDWLRGWPNMAAQPSIAELSNSLETGLVTSVQLVKTFVSRIQDIDRRFNSIVAVNPNALSAAEALDAERAQGATRGPLHGIPVLVKNNIATADLPNTAGSCLLANVKTRDAFVVQKLRAAGAVVLATTNLTQWANYRWRDAQCECSGWSSYNGQTIAAYHDRQDPEGSSSGSAVAVDLFLGPVALGTETDGSILCPAHRSNIVGIKPTVGLTSRHLVVPITERQDTVGPMARTVRDAALLLSAMAGRDPSDKYTSDAPEGVDYSSACKDGALRDARIGVPWKAIREEASDVEITAFEKALEGLKAAGAVIVDADFAVTHDELWTVERPVFWHDFPVNLAAYLEAVEAPMRTLADVRDATQSHPKEDYPARNTKNWDIILEGKYDNRNPEFAKILEEYKAVAEKGLPYALNKFGLDAVAMPTSAAPKWSAVVGYPTITVPLGKYPDDADVKMHKCGGLVETGPGVPFGFSFLGGRYEEEKLIGFAYGFEKLYGRQ